ncbi:glutamate receptor 2.9-like [Wolffia australiana]
MNSIIEKHVFEFRSNLEQKSSVECSSDKMERRAVLLLLFVLLAERPVLSQSLNRLKDPIPVKVGVIIDMGTLVGKMCWTSISLAVDDIYAKNPNLTTRLVLYPRDGKADVMAAGSAALGLVNKEGVSAILGPQKSGQAKFLADIAGKARVPLLTFSATSPFLSSSASPTY